jgi:lipoprotein NlpD
VGYGCASSGSIQAATYVVRPQDTLYSIAWRHDLDFKDLARWNNIGPEYRIEVGQVLQLQPGARSSASRPATQSSAATGTQQPAPTATRPAARPAAQPAPSATRPAAQPAPQPAPSATPPAANLAAHPGPNLAPQPPRVGASQPLANLPAGPTASALPAGTVLQWVWPTDRSAAPKPVPGGGILVLGQLGQSVRAACSGRVVYTGSGIRGYGNLIIIKHGENLLSAYAHTNELLVREGENVAGGQTIAHMGTGPHQIAALYFEIRLNGKPVDPVPYLNGVK